MRYPEEVITVPASLTKRVHYEVSYDYPKNVISTARYNVVTFLPAQLLAQFSKVANVYFLFIAALQQVPGWSTTGRWTTILPLSVFVSLSIAHEGFDDFRRHRMDHAENSQRTRVLKVKVHDRERLSARRWAVSAISIGSTIKDTIGKRLAEKRRKKRELEDSDDEDEQPGGAEVFEGDESLLRRQITRGVMSLRSWRGAPPSVRPGQSTNNDLDTPLAEGSAVSYEQDDEAQANPLPENMSCRWKKKRWENVQVGDLLMICKDEWIPADCVVIASTGFDGTCFVETASLDGETTLKQKQALEVTNSEIQTAEQLAAFNAFTHVEPPSSELYGFEGFMEIGGERYPLTPNQLLLRGSVLRNTAYVFAQVVYSGEQTRLRLNATRNVRTKAPQIQRITNRIVIFVFILLLVLCFVFAGLGIHWNNDNRQGHWYLSTVHMPATALIFGYIVMMNALIPISLYVTLEAVKIFQCWFIQQDVGMYHPDSDTRAEARTTAINEDLGMVRYVFSDKTGTLTENIMKLRAVMVAGFSYLHIDLDRLKESPAQKSEPQQVCENAPLLGDEASESSSDVDPDIISSGAPGDPRMHTKASDDAPVSDLQALPSSRLIMDGQTPPTAVFRARAEWFLRCMALCHTVQPDRDPLTGRITGYQATSPDEKALVAAAAELGFVMNNRAGPLVQLRVVASERMHRLGNYEVLDVLEFSSARKRMSVILRCPDGRIIMMSKGADSAIWPRLCSISQLQSDPSDEEWARARALEALHQFSTEGLRTLAYAHKEIPEATYEAWHTRYLAATTALNNRQEQVEAVCEEIEGDLLLSGVSAIEDRLQEGVPETIFKLRRAGIRVWMLTGDKVETAVNIAKSCRLIETDMLLLVMQSLSDPDALERTITPGSDAGTGASLAVVVDGETLGLLESHPALLDRFLSLGTLCDAVICSRVSPSQKALIVHNMRVRCEGGGLFTHDNDRYMVTLAIGDGGNDIAMIQEAHVGIGIAGQEGLQASRAADFSIGQFRFLQRLLLVHGRWSYVRVSMFIMGTFYKCMAFYVTQLIYQFYTGFSGTSLFENWTLSMYNTLFSILPVLVVGIFEQDLKPETLLTYPELYRDMGPSNHLFTVPEFIRRVVVIGILHSIVAAYFPIAGGLLLGYNGTTNDQFINGLMIYCIMVLIVTLKIAYIDVRRWVVFSHISVVLSLALWFGWNGVLNHIYPDSPGEGYFVQGVFDMLMSKATFWFQWIIFTAVALCLNVLILIVYSIRDPVEHRITSWVAFERRKEHLANKYRRKQWLADHNIKPSWM
ncbi:hypothetical protein BX667DRAFT_487844 [Coemansia mojavensis]|nr:hypothetical protein BX667DRAFT_487844 [Coemansia mojavensis]